MVPLLFASLALAGPSATGAWQPASLDGGTVKALVLESPTVVKDYQGTTATPQLEIRCERGKVQLWLRAGLTLDASGDNFDDSWALAEVRYDDEASSLVKLRRGDWRDSGRFPKRKKTLASWREHRTLTLAFVPFASEPAVATFDLLGLEESLDHFAGSCTW